MTRNDLHRRLQVLEAAVGHLSRLQWRKAGRSGGSAGRGILLARVDLLERAMAQALRSLEEITPGHASEAFDLLETALGESDWRGELSGWDGKEELPLCVPVPVGSEILVEGKRYQVLEAQGRGRRHVGRFRLVEK